jgi:hypothetical protein
MTQDPDVFRRYEARLAALEAQCPTPEEREITAFLIKVVRAARLTLWLTNGSVKYGAGPLGIIWGLYTYGTDLTDWLVGFATMGSAK